jgi:hypothetical protein
MHPPRFLSSFPLLPQNIHPRAQKQIHAHTHSLSLSEIGKTTTPTNTKSLSLSEKNKNTQKYKTLVCDENGRDFIFSFGDEIAIATVCN